MEGNLLRKENEFYKLNEQLELKAQKLMEEVEYVMKNPDLPKTVNESSISKVRVLKGGTLFDEGFSKPHTDQMQGFKTKANTVLLPSESRESSNLADNSCSLLSEQRQSTSTADYSPDLLLAEKRQENSEAATKQLAGIVAKLDSLPDAAKGVGPEAALHILKVKSQLLERELETVQLELKNKTEAYTKSRLRYDRLEEDHEKWHHQAESVQQLYQKQQSRLEQINSDLVKKDTENNSLLKKVECLRKELKQTCQSGATTKAKLNRCLDENGKLKSALSKLDIEEKELKELNRTETERSMEKINLLEKRKKDLVRGINTQLELIGNLKTQLVHMDVLLNVKSAEEILSTSI